MTGAPDQEAREFAAVFRSFLEWVHSDSVLDRNEVVALVAGYLGEGAGEHSVVTRSLPPFEHVNLQTALDEWSREPGREVAVHGLTIPPHHPPVTLQQLLNSEGMPWLRLSAPALTDLPNGPDSTLACLQRALLLVDDAAGRYVVMVSAPGEHGHDATLDVEIAGLDVDGAQEVHARLAELRHRLNVYRGHVIEVGLNQMGNVVLEFARIPATARDEVVLPEAVLGRVERHALGIATHREALLAAGQHLKRGLLLYGPPGTGKTHTTRYLVGQMAAYTRFVVTGRALHAIGAVSELARDLQPAVIILEDVDLVAEHRGFGPSMTPVLFELLDAMDGAAADADLLFVLTTNRADLLEPALAARPGRVDVAIEIDLPDQDGRIRLLDLYGRSLPLRLSEDDRREIVERMDGVTASFVKEMLRRAMLESLQENPTDPVVTAAHTSRALDDLLDAGQKLTRSLLGVGNDPEALAPGGGLGPPPPPHAARGWITYGPAQRVRRFPG